VRRGEVWWVERPDAGPRPHLILTRDAAIDVVSSVLGVPATRTVRGIASEVELGPDDGMPERCVLTLDNTRVLQKAHFRERICTLGPERMASVCRALAIATGCA
jgi:mRNA interferase MazF